MKSFFKEFKEFINKGNVVDLAVGVIIGTAFSKIVSSVVNDLIMPIVGIIIGGHDFTNLTIKFRDASITYGNFIQNVIDFLIIALCVFLFVKIINRITRKQKKEEIKEDEQILLLEEIRDLLKEQQTKPKNKKSK